MNTLAVVKWAATLPRMRALQDAAVRCWFGEMNQKREEGAAMTPQTPDLAGIMGRLDMMLERLNALELQVSGLIHSESVEAQAFVLKDDRGQIRARLDLRDHASRLTFYDRIGGERLHIGLHMDGTPDVASITERTPGA